MTLYLSQKKLLILLLSAFAIGFFLAFVYDGIRLLRTLRQPKKKAFRFVNALLVSLEDFVFFTFCGAVMSILFYITNSGKVRPSAFVMAVLGFCLFRVTLSRVIYPVMVRFLCFVKLPFAFGLRVVKAVFAAMARVFAKRKARRFFKKLARLGEKGYLYGLRRL